MRRLAFRGSKGAAMEESTAGAAPDRGVGHYERTATVLLPAAAVLARRYNWS